MYKFTFILLISVVCFGCVKSTKLNEVAPALPTSQADTLFTFKFSVDGYLPNAYFIATDSLGNIISELKVQKGKSTYNLVTTQAYKHSRINAYEIDIPTDPTAGYYIDGYLQVKKGSKYDISGGASSPSNRLSNIHFKNFSSISSLNLSTDRQSNSTINAADTIYYRNFGYSDNSKVFVQIEKNNRVLYNFFDIAKGTQDYNVDLNQCIKVPQTKQVTAPGDHLSITVYARPHKNSDERYDLGNFYTLGNRLDYYYPTEKFEQYETHIGYQIYDKHYIFTSVGPAMPSQADSYDASFNFTGKSLADCRATTNGSYSYYSARFISNNIGVNLYSPVNTSNIKFKLPDFSKYIDKSVLDPNQLILLTFGLYQVAGFNEGIFPYANPNSINYINSKAVESN